MKEVQTLLRANSDNFSLNAELDDESHTELADIIEQTSVPSAEDEHAGAVAARGAAGAYVGALAEGASRPHACATASPTTCRSGSTRSRRFSIVRARRSLAVLATAAGESVRRAGDHAERARAAAALHESECEGVVAILVRARRPRSPGMTPQIDREPRAALRVAQAAGRRAEGGRGAADRGEDDAQAALRRAAGRRADAARHRRDPGPLARARAPDRVARGGKMP